MIAISPIVGGAPVKGPADRLMAPLGIDVSCVGVARAYAEICGALVIDEVDAHLADRGGGGGRSRDRHRHDDAQPRDRDRARSPHARRGRLIELRCPPRFPSCPIAGIGEIRPGDEIAELIRDAATAQNTPLDDRDCLVVTQKIVSKAEGRLVELDPLDRDARRRLVESESVRIVRRRGDLIDQRDHVTASCPRTRASTSRTWRRVGPRCSRSTPTARPSTSATRCARAVGIEVGVIVSDTFGRPWRQGLTDVAIGVSGISAIDRPARHARRDSAACSMVTEVAIADEIASAAELVMGKASAVPVAIVRGLDASWFGDGLRTPARAPAARRPLPMNVRSSQVPAFIEQRRSIRSFRPDPVDRDRARHA